MTVFKVNTGLRELSVCWLRWEWEVQTNGNVTYHYFGAELEELIQAEKLIAGGNSRKNPTVTLIHKKCSRRLKLTA